MRGTGGIVMSRSSYEKASKGCWRSALGGILGRVLRNCEIFDA
jgi:hypothetical protein